MMPSRCKGSVPVHFENPVNQGRPRDTVRGEPNLASLFAMQRLVLAQPCSHDFYEYVCPCYFTDVYTVYIYIQYVYTGIYPVYVYPIL